MRGCAQARCAVSLLLVVVSAVRQCSAQAALLDAGDAAALRDLASSLGVPGTPSCEWAGVTCECAGDAANNGSCSVRVTALVWPLREGGAGGHRGPPTFELPSSLGLLSALSTLYLRNAGIRYAFLEGSATAGEASAQQVSDFGFARLPVPRTPHCCCLASCPDAGAQYLPRSAGWWTCSSWT